MTASCVSTEAASDGRTGLIGTGRVGRWRRDRDIGPERPAATERRTGRDIGLRSGAGLGQLLLELGDRARTAHELGLSGCDLFRCLRLLVLRELFDLVAVLDRVLDELLDRIQVRIAHGGQLDRRKVEVVFDAVLDPNRHQRVKAELDQRHLPGEVLGLVAHRAADDRAETMTDRLTGIRGPLRKACTEIGAAGEVVGQDLDIVILFSDGGGETCSATATPVATADGSAAAAGFHTVAADDGVVDQRERLVHAGVHLHARPAGVAGQRRHKA